ncbi:FliM/FliN family flagellar motor switch protein [Ramlibacter sp. XY19]|uniref:FliM/FliN family flagellar motor switch protein n=1 Tax=Ramlibacter paludis TaxID=2908000 RepID=UPI0023DB6ED4|nr:FliM/FliN family flagellar motor switch protein [Ramlibacter paludis]MCG2594959.1 FliM/FliN family flagellar motor switch protein [Ramlibacter paludis]
MSQMIESFMNDETPVRPRARSVALEELADASMEGAALLADVNPLLSVKVQLQVRVGSVSMTLGQLMAARENAVLTLDRTVDQPVDLVLEGRTVARGQLVAVDDCFAVRITELPLALKL